MPRSVGKVPQEMADYFLEGATHHFQTQAPKSIFLTQEHVIAASEEVDDEAATASRPTLGLSNAGALLMLGILAFARRRRDTN